MNKSLVIGLAVGAAAAAGAGAVAGLKVMSRGPQYADVVQVTPLTHTIRTPKRDCHDDTVVHQRPARDKHQIFGTVAGAVVGGLLGHYVGGGTGRDIATGVGAAAGGYAGNRIENKVQRGNTYTTTEHRCTTVYERTVEQQGYEVRYRIGDKEGRVRMDHDPGQRIPLQDGRLVLSDGSQTS